MRISDWSSDVCSSDLDADTGALILLDIAAEPPKDGEAELEPVRIVEGSSTPARYGDQAGGADEDPARAQDQSVARAARRETPVPVVLTRFAAQNLYAPLRTVEPLAGVMRVNLRRGLDLGTLMPTLPVRADALASWSLENQWVTAVRLTNSSSGWVSLDPRALNGAFLTAPFQHEAIGRASCRERVCQYV